MTYRERTRDGVIRLTGSTSTGVPGPPGPPGPSSSALEFSFVMAATTWRCVHNLNQLVVDVRTTDTDGDELEGEVVYVDVNTVDILWYFPVSGKAVVDP